MLSCLFFFSSRRRHTRWPRDWSSDVCSSDLGYDLVCAGVSAVSFGVVNAIDALCKIDLEIEQANEGGYLHVSIPNDMNQELSDKVQLLLEGMIISLQTIEREYSQFIKIDSK